MPLAKLKNLISTKSSDQYLVGLDIGTEYVKALIGRVTATSGGRQQVEVIGTGRQHQQLGDMFSGAVADINSVVDNCDLALSAAEEVSGVTAKKVVIGMAGELVKGVTTTIRYRRHKSATPLEAAELRKIITSVEERALERAQAQLAWESGQSNIEIKLVNSALVSVQIDGYKVTNPIGFQGKDVSIQLFCAFAPMVHVGALEKIAFDLDLDVVSITAEPFAVAKSVGVEEDENFNAIFIDIGGGTTDIAVVNEGGIEGTKMFGIGGRSFTSSVARATDKKFELAEELKLRYSHGELKGELEPQVKAALVATLEVWLSGIELALKEFALDQLPSKILLCGGGSGLPEITEALKSNSAWRRDLPFAKEISVQHIAPGQVHRVQDRTGQASDYTFITPLGLLNQGLDALEGRGGTTIIERINRLLQV